jgi:hypothetical protein
MTHTLDSLRAASRRLSAFRELAAKSGRADDAQALAVGADVCGLFADNFGTSASPASRAEEPADAARARARLAGTMVAIAEPVGGQECCPYTREGLCPSCTVFHGAFTIDGSSRRFVCLSKWTPD